MRAWRARGGAALLAALTLAACSYFGMGEEKPVRLGPIYSPNGEPLSGGRLGDPKCPDVMAAWLARVDQDHDGAIDLGEFLADARRQFAAMDLDKTGVLTPDVLARYRAPYSTGRSLEVGSDDDGNSDDDKRRRREGRGPPVAEDRPDPVMLADTGLRNRVTLEQFLAYERRNFATLDKNRDGRLDHDELAALCPE
jgi:hypothetical protein